MIMKKESLSLVNWKIEEEVANDCKISPIKSQKVINLINDGCTVPFIARYRKECTGNLSATVLNKIKGKMEECKEVIHTVERNMKSIRKSGLLNDNVRTALQNCKTLDDVEFVVEPFKSKGPKSLAGRARKVGLETLANKILFEKRYFEVSKYVPREALDEFGNLSEVEQGIRNIVADIFAKDFELLDKLEKLNCSKTTYLQSHLKKKYAQNKSKENIDKETKKNIDKIKLYHNFKNSIKGLRPHQVMAINRGEKQKILSVTIVFPDALKSVYTDLCTQKYISGLCNEFVCFVSNCVDDAYQRLILPFLTRKIRNMITKEAQMESLLIFESNLRQLVMTSPLRSVPILGIDPGYYNGCKVALINAEGNVLETAIFHLSRGEKLLKEAENRFLKFIFQYNVRHIAIGDGCGNYIAAKFVANMIASNPSPEMAVVKFAIVRECGASVYSVSKEASDELPDMDPNLRSAVSVARRLQNPLGEYVKIDPKCLGVGMYQHDLSSKALLNKINCVLNECISFVGVDVNHAPAHILQHISGLGINRAQAIVEYREKNGPFKNRADIMKVKGIKDAIFTQCAGFIRIKHNECISNEFKYDPDGDAQMEDLTSVCHLRSKKVKTSSFEPLDQTSIHPESYEQARIIIEMLNCIPNEIGTGSLQRAAVSFMKNPNYESVLQTIATETIGLETLKDIVISLSRPLEFDERFNFQSSMLRNFCGSLSNLSVGQTVRGFVHNVTTFGLFIDIGVENNAFCHQIRNDVVLGDVVTAKVKSIDSDRINLENIMVCNK